MRNSEGRSDFVKSFMRRSNLSDTSILMEHPYPVGMGTVYMVSMICIKYCLFPFDVLNDNGVQFSLSGFNSTYYSRIIIFIKYHIRQSEFVQKL